MDLTTLLKFLAKGREGIDEKDPQQLELDRIAQLGAEGKNYVQDTRLSPDMGETYMPEEDINNPFYDRQDPEWRRKKMLQRLALGLEQQQPEPRFLASSLFDSQGGTY